MFGLSSPVLRLEQSSDTVSNYTLEMGKKQLAIRDKYPQKMPENGRVSVLKYGH
jgi:hypothetical protein